MAIAHEHLDVRDAVERRSRAECVPEREGCECGVAAGAATACRTPIPICFSDRGQILGSCNGVVDVDDAPFTVELLAVLPPEAG